MCEQSKIAYNFYKNTKINMYNVIISRNSYYKLKDTYYFLKWEFLSKEHLFTFTGPDIMMEVSLYMYMYMKTHSYRYM